MLSDQRSWDPLYGRIAMTKFEFGLLRLSEVQRLRYVRMCNINSLLVTGASEISRFEHTIGVMHLAKKWIQAHSIQESVGIDIVAAAVLHDMQTGPFGHSMQYVFEDNVIDSPFFHEDLYHSWNSMYHQEVFAGASFAGQPFGAQKYLGNRWENVTRIIRGEGPYGPLIAGTMDLDNIDNVIRLAYHVGIIDRKDCSLPLVLAQHIFISDGDIVVPNSIIPIVKRWQEIRHNLYKLLLYDWAEFSAKAMLTNIIERAAVYQLIGTDSWIRTDSEFLDYLDSHAIGDAQEIRELVRRLRRGDLYEPVALLTSPSIEAYAKVTDIDTKKNFEIRLRKCTKRKNFRPLVHFILDNGKTDREVIIKSLDNDEYHVIGKCSRQLLSGLFISIDSLSKSEKDSLVNDFIELLEEYGVKNNSKISDPMQYCSA